MPNSTAWSTPTAPDAQPRVERRRLVGDALHLGHHRQAEGRAAPAARRARRRARPCGAEPLPQRRAHPRRHAALSHDGRALAARHVADRRRLRLPAALRRGARAGTDRARADHQPLSRADALPRPRASSGAFKGTDVALRAQARLRRRADDRRPAEDACSSAFEPELFVNHYGSSEIYTFTIDQDAPTQARLGRPRRHQPDGAGGEARAPRPPTRSRTPAKRARSRPCCSGRRILRGLLAQARGRRQGAAAGLVFHRRHRLLRRGRRPLRHRPGRRHDHHRGRKRLAGRNRKLPLAARRPFPRSPSSACPTSAGARSSPPSSSAAVRSSRTSSTASAAPPDLPISSAPAATSSFEAIPKSPVGKLLRRMLVAGDYEVEAGTDRSKGTAA